MEKVEQVGNVFSITRVRESIICDKKEEDNLRKTRITLLPHQQARLIRSKESTSMNTFSTPSRITTPVRQDQ